ncbi:hypothetical protein Vi05172_g8819 [Venturia inaequalis]|nr:hypothetical protein Vi05172_g8819 [Venturia inaequalis]
MRFLQILFLITPLSIALATTPTLTEDDAIPALLAPRQNSKQKPSEACTTCNEQCEETWGSVPGVRPRIELCKCLGSCATSIKKCPVPSSRCGK